MHELVTKYARQAGLEDVSSHTLRRSFAKHTLDLTKDLVAVAALLGHEKLETTAIYTRPSERDATWSAPSGGWNENPSRTYPEAAAHRSPLALSVAPSCWPHGHAYAPHWITSVARALTAGGAPSRR